MMSLPCNVWLEAPFDTRSDEFLLAGSGGRASLPPGVRCTDDAAPPFMSSEGLDHAFDNLRGVSVVESKVLRLLPIRILANLG